jgi:hypothetical protein
MKLCFLTPPMALWAEAGRRQSLPNTAATMMMAIALFFMGPSPDVLRQIIRCPAYTDMNDCRQIENPARRKTI